MVLIAVCGKPNVGKSTFMASCTGSTPQIANYPFTTIDPNKGVGFVRAACPHVRLNVKCDPNNSECRGGTRLVPVNIVDVAGIVPGAHEGKGMGNRFLTDVASAEALIIVADASGGTDDNGNIVAEGTHDASADVKLFLDELDEWFLDVVKRNAEKAKSSNNGLADFYAALTGIGVPLFVAKAEWESLGLPKEPHKYAEKPLKEFAVRIRKKTKPFLIAANKCDSKHGQENLDSLAQNYPDAPIVAMCADYELALQKARKNGLVEYDGNAASIKPTQKAEQNPAVAQALAKISQTIAKLGSTGVADAIDRTVYGLAGYTVAFPVEDETHYSNHFGKVLPDAILLKRGSTAVDLAAAIHADLAKHFLYAIDCEKKTRISKELALPMGAVVKIVATK